MLKVNIMKLFRTKIWNWWDVWLLKVCVLLFGIIAGAYFHEYIMEYSRVILVLAVILAIRPAIAYFKD